MTAVGGSISSVNLDGREFAVAADADANRKLGGWENEVLANGGPTARLIKTRIPLSIEGLPVEIDDSRGDQEYLQDLADRNDFFTIGITFVSGSVYQGSGQLTGDVAASTQSATAPINIMGPGRLTRQ